MTERQVSFSRELAENGLARDESLPLIRVRVQARLNPSVLLCHAPRPACRPSLERLSPGSEKAPRSGTEKSTAFKQLAEEAERPYDSIRGSYYSHKKKLEGGEVKPRTRRRETTPEDALADARASLERSITSIDKEVEAAKARAQEAAGEYEAIRGSAEERKQAITERLEALK